MLRIIKWLWVSYHYSWWTHGCHHVDSDLNDCDRMDGHPGKCRTAKGKEFSRA